jgi:hypothetical protein
MAVTEFRRLACLTIVACIAMMPARAHAQWWSSAPTDFEDCAEQAAKAASKEAKAAQLAQCESQFAGRRKPGGGYSYFDFMQNRHFDIAGPNPTAEELKQMDEHYTAFLDQRRRSIIAAAFAEKQRQQQLAALEPEKRAAPPRPAIKPAVALDKPPIRPKRTVCREESFSCGWSRWTAGINSLKKSLFGPQPKKPRGTQT